MAIMHHIEAAIHVDAHLFLLLLFARKNADCGQDGRKCGDGEGVEAEELGGDTDESSGEQETSDDAVKEAGVGSERLRVIIEDPHRERERKGGGRVEKLRKIRAEKLGFGREVVVMMEKGVAMRVLL